MIWAICLLRQRLKHVASVGDLSEYLDRPKPKSPEDYRKERDAYWAVHDLFSHHLLLTLTRGSL